MLSLDSDGSDSAATMHYNADGAPAGLNLRFTATATADGTVKVPYTWSGLHAWFNVTANLQTIVNGNVTDSSTQGPELLHTPSNGFLYGGVETFDVAGRRHLRFPSSAAPTATSTTSSTARSR